MQEMDPRHEILADNAEPFNTEENSMIQAGIAVSETVRTTLGPTALDKMLIDSEGMGMVTNDGAAILKELNIDNPIADLVIGDALSQETSIGDGTTTAAVLTGSLLQQAEDLIEGRIHPTTIIDGYTQALSITEERIDEISNTVTPDDDVLEHLARTAINSKGGPNSEDALADLVLEATRSVSEDGKLDTDRIIIEKITGEPVEQSGLLDGLIMELHTMEPEFEGMPMAVEHGTVAVLDQKIEPSETVHGVDWDISPDNPTDFTQINSLNEGIVDDFVAADVDVVLCGQTIDEKVRAGLAANDILAIRRLNADDVTRAAQACGAEVLESPKNLTEENLGKARRVQESYLGNNRFFVLEGTANPGCVSLVIRGSTKQIVDENTRAVRNCLGTVETVLEDQRVVPGGGASEMAISQTVRQQARSVSGRAQLALDGFADALELIPRTLIENAGREPIDGLVELRHQHDRGNLTTGFDAHSGKCADMFDLGVVDSATAKVSAVRTAVEITNTILRIDEIITSTPEPESA